MGSRVGPSGPAPDSAQGPAEDLTLARWRIAMVFYALASLTFITTGTAYVSQFAGPEVELPPGVVEFLGFLPVSVWGWCWIVAGVAGVVGAIRGARPPWLFAVRLQLFILLIWALGYTYGWIDSWDGVGGLPRGYLTTATYSRSIWFELIAWMMFEHFRNRFPKRLWGRLSGHR